MKRNSKKLCTVVCPECHRPRQTETRSLKINPSGICAECNLAKRQGDGASNPNWKGGHRHWSPGRFGRDKNGLSWKTQRRLAWGRDKFTCQECGKHKDGWKPDVHHISPFRVSQSHALENLKCYCRKCHMQEEAKVQEQWGGQLVVRSAPPKIPTQRVTCSGCGRNTRRPIDGRCHRCSHNHQLKVEALRLHAAGLSNRAIGRHLGVSHFAVAVWLGYKPAA